MRRILRDFVSSVISLSGACLRRGIHTMRPLPLIALFAATVVAPTVQGKEIPDRVVRDVDATQVQPLPNHFPQWANSANDLGALPADTEINRFTIVLARSPQQEAAFVRLLADQQNPASPEYHHWLTPAEVGERFGLSLSDIAAVTGWLQSQGLHVTFVSPSRLFIGFGGKAADLGRAFQTELHNYKVSGGELVSVSSEPMVPQALAPVFKAVRGLYTIQDKPLHHESVGRLPSPGLTVTPGSEYFVAPADFATIYDLPTAQTGTGQTIGIVGESRTDTADFNNFRSLTGSTFPNPNEIIPTLYGGIDPGPAVTTQVANPPGVQGEAELDVTRSGSVAPGATIDLVVASQASGGIDPAVQYLVHTSPVPAQVMSISFGGCELNAGAVGVTFWDSLFQIAASEGISVFVASGDSGASGCDPYNAAPPVSPSPNSPNYICSSSYATCVGGTEFNDASSYTTYWNNSNTSSFGSAISYIPEGAWNDPLTSTSTTQAASTGGGVSNIIPTPTWQTGTGVPAARAGRYTPDISFTSAEHDGYFGCLADSGGDCVNSSTGIPFVSFSGTSAAAPDMAGIAVLLDQKLGGAQGNLNPVIYSMAATVPAAFHDVTVASSGVAGCVVTTPSICNNSIPSRASLTGGQSGFLVDTGYDEATGWGSLDVTQFINNFSAALTPAATTGAASSITSTTATLNGTMNPNGADTAAYFDYSPSNTLSPHIQTPSQDVGSGTSAVPFSAPVTGLTPGTTYYFAAFGLNVPGGVEGHIVSFVTLASAPVPTTGTASAITGISATVAGTVNPNGADTHIWFLYGTSSTLAGAAQTSSQDIGSGNAAVAVIANLTGLTLGTKYYFQVVAQNAVGTTIGAIASFTTLATAPAPTAITGAASSITSTTANVAGTVNPEGAATNVWFLYGTNSSLAGASQTTTQAIGAGTVDVQVSANLAGLTASTVYYFQVVAQNTTGTTKGLIVSFTTPAPPQAPTVTTGAASSFTSTTAAVAGSVNPNGQATNVWFLYGTSSSLAGASQTTSQAIGSGSAAIAVSANLTGLTASTPYYFQAVAQNNTGTTKGAIVSFTTTATPIAPTTTTGTASLVTHSSAALAGTVNPNGQATNVWFLYGTSSTLAGAAQTTSQAIGSGSAAVAVSANLTGLNATTTYYFQAVAQNATGTSNGIIASFTTPAIPLAPTATTGTATALTDNSAALAGSVNPNAQATSVWFLYGTSSTLAGAAQTPTQAIGSGIAAVAVNANLTGLIGSTTYYFQTVAQNPTGTTNGSIVSFTTTAPYAITSGTPTITVARGATTGNTSTFSVTPQAGFTSTVNLTCAITPAAASDPPTCAMSPASLTNFTGTTAQTSTLTISTTAATTALNQTRKLFWPSAGGAVLALALLFGIPARRRSWRAMLGMIALFFVLAGGVAACGGGGGNGGGGGGNPGTSAGNYTVTVTGTSGTVTETGTVALTVQ